MSHLDNFHRFPSFYVIFVQDKDFLIASVIKREFTFELDIWQFFSRDAGVLNILCFPPFFGFFMSSFGLPFWEGTLEFLKL